MKIASGLTRRDFLKLGGLGLASLYLPNTLERASSIIDQLDQPLQGRVTEATVNVHQKPDSASLVTNFYWRDIVLPITGLAISDDQAAYNRIWYQVNGKGYAYSGSIQPVQTILNDPVTSLPRPVNLVEVTVPYTEARRFPRQMADVVYRFYFETTHWVDAVFMDEEGSNWYRVVDDKFKQNYYVQARHLRLIPDQDLLPLSPQVPDADKRLEVHLDQQMVIAFEEDQAVFMTRASTGGSFNRGIFTTPVGRWSTFHKRPSAHMAAGDLASNGFDLPGVPWVSYVTESGVAFHGTFWHNDFGKPRSHGCINISSQAARWIYRWTQPIVPPGEQYRFLDTGTRVDIVQ